MARAAITKAVRAWFDEQGFAEVETGILQVSPGNETHLHAPRTELIRADGTHVHAIFADLAGIRLPRNCSPRAKQKSSNSPACSATASAAICICPNSPCWNGIAPTPAYDAVMADSIVVIAHAAQATGIGRFLVSGQDRRSLCRAGTADGRSRVRALCRDRSAGDDPGWRGRSRRACATRQKRGYGSADDDTWSDIFSKVLVEHVEPHLGQGRLTVLFEYPAPEAALARAKPADPRVAERFEVYACGVELANGFGELTDAAEQRRRFTRGDGRKAAALWRALSARRGFSRSRRQQCRRPAASRSASTGW